VLSRCIFTGSREETPRAGNLGAAEGVTDKERAKDEAAITEALRLIAEADERVILSLMRGIDTIEAERLIGKMQTILKEIRQTAKG
jgi:hypothetical protein